MYEHNNVTKYFPFAVPNTLCQCLLPQGFNSFNGKPAKSVSESILLKPTFVDVPSVIKRFINRFNGYISFNFGLYWKLCLV